MHINLLIRNYQPMHSPVTTETQLLLYQQDLYFIVTFHPPWPCTCQLSHCFLWILYHLIRHDFGDLLGPLHAHSCPNHTCIQLPAQIQGYDLYQYWYCQKRLHKYKYQCCKYASIQVWNMQVCKYASMQVCKYASMRVCEYASIKVCKYACKQECKCASMKICKCTSMQVGK